MSRHTILSEVSDAYGEGKNRYHERSRRGDVDGADDALSEMQTIERCVTVIETSTAWREAVEEGRRNRRARR